MHTHKYSLRAFCIHGESQLPHKLAAEFKMPFFRGTGKAGNAKWKLPLKQFGKLYSKRYLLWATKGFRHL